ncbi:MAG: hypothetical protein R3B09_32525 [Nannocystaceae bacterium]
MRESRNFHDALLWRVLVGLGFTAVVDAACVDDGGSSTTAADSGASEGSTTADDGGSTTETGGATSTGEDTTTSASGDTSGTGDASSDSSASTTGDATTGGTTAGDTTTGAMTTGDATTGDTTGDTTTGDTTTGNTTTGNTTTGDTTEGTTTSGSMQDVERCWPKGDAPCAGLREAAAQYKCTNMFEPVVGWDSGPVEMGDQCCYHVDVDAPGGACVPGRPFVVDGQIRLASITEGSARWLGAPGIRRRPAATRRPTEGAMTGLSGLSPAIRARLGRAWAEDGAFEHASVASFGKLALELLAFGAPAELVRAAHEAALTEVLHAELCFALASRYFGAPMGPGALTGAAAFTGASSLEALAVAAVREGCVGEALAAAVAEAQREAATDPSVRAALAIIVADEVGHAELAGRVVAWAIEVGGASVRASVIAAFDAALAELGREREEDDDAREDDAALRAHGRLSPAEARAVRRRAVTEVILPVVAALA